MSIEDLFPLTEQRCHELHLYKELMSPQERRDRYTLLRISGATTSQAQRWRDWSPPHYEMMLTYLENPPNLKPNPSTKGTTE